MRALILVAVLAMLVPSSRATAAAISLHPCEVKGLSQPARCGVLDVPENPQQPQGRHLAIHVMVVPSKTTPAQPDPIVPLMGGPGEDAIGNAADLADQFATLRTDRDLLLVDQRGAGQSGALHCDLYDERNPAASLKDLFPPEAVKRCERQLSSQANLTQYTYRHFANDLEEVRKALGYGRLNLSAGSYGTRAAQVFVRTFPGSVRTVFLGSVVPIDIAIPGPFAVTSQAALEKMLQACDVQPECRKTFPNLRAELDEVSARLEAGKATVQLANGPAILDRGRVAEWFRSKLYRPHSATELPWLIHRAYGGDWQPIAQGILADARAYDSALSFGLLFSITCSDDVPFLQEKDFGVSVEKTFLKDYRVQQQRAVCAIWPKETVPENYRKAIVSSVPTLFASGDSDSATPLSFMEHAAKGFSNAVTTVEVGQGHTESNPCVAAMYEDLVRTGSSQGLERRHCEPVARPPFKTGS